MKITQELLDNHSKLYDELEEIQKNLQDAYLKARQDDEVLIKYKNDKGEEIEVKQKVAWLEVRALGFRCNSGKVLAEKYPDVVKYKDEEDKKVQECKEYEVKGFGFNYENLSLRNTIKLIIAVVRFVTGK